MKVIVLLLSVFVLFSCGVKKYSVDDFFKNVEKSRYQISPDGNYISYMAPYQKRMNVFVQEIASGDTVRVTSETVRDLAGYFWKGARIFYIKDSGGDENYKLYAVDATGKNQQTIVDIPKVRMQLIDGLEYLPDQLIIGINQRDPKVFDPYRVNVNTGKMTLIMQNPGNVTGWMTDHQGQLRLAIVTDGVNHTYLYRDNEKQKFKTMMTINFRDSFSPLFFTFDNKRLYASSNLGRDKQAIVEFDPQTQKEVNVIFQHQDYDASQLFYSRKDKKLLSVGFVSWKEERQFLNDQMKQLYQGIKTQLPGDEIFLTSTNDDEDKFIVRTMNDRSRGAYYLYDEQKKKLKLLTEISPWLNAKDMASMKPVEFKSRDGLTIHGYLTLPKDVSGKVPFVINPHGGPWARDVWGYNTEVQFLANRGYGVFQINYRGSTGYGKKFWAASFKQWGKRMQDDITDGVHWLIENGYADATKIAIYGGSYGGYATLAGITFTPELYCCAIDYVGVSNIFTLLKTIPPYWKPGLQMFYQMIGDPEKDKKLLEEVSPVFHANKIKVPLFIAQGANDPRVNKAESDQMVEALRKRGIEVDYMVKDNEGHGFHNEENRLEFYRAMEKFLGKYMTL